MDRDYLKGEKGFSIIELLIVLAISGILTSALYQTFIGLQKTYAIQDQVVEVRQNVRYTIDRMTREIRMAGYGGNILESFGSVNTYPNLINPVNGVDQDFITIVMADEVAKLSQNTASGSIQLILSGSNPGEMFDTDKKKYLCLNGQNNYLVQSVSGNTVTLTTPLLEDHLINESVSLVKAITYKILPSTTDLVRDENTGEGGQAVAEGVEDLQLKYTLSDGTVVDSPTTPSDIRIVSITVTARTKMNDPQYPGDGCRRQSLTSLVEVRNLSL